MYSGYSALTNYLYVTNHAHRVYAIANVYYNNGDIMSRTKRRKSGDRRYIDGNDPLYKGHSTTIKTVAVLFETDKISRNTKTPVKRESKRIRRLAQNCQLVKILKRGIDIEIDNDYDISKELKDISNKQGSYWC